MNRLLRLLCKDKILSIRFLIIFLILIYIPMALYISFVYTRTIDTVEKEKIDDIEQILKQTSQSVNLTLNNIEKGVFEIANHNGIQVGVQNFDSLMEPYKNNISEFTERQFAILKNNIPYVDGFACITKDGQIVAVDKKIEVDSQKFFRSDSYKRLISSNHSNLWSYEAPDYIHLKSNKQKLLFLVYKITNLDSSEDVGYFFVTIRPESFKALYADTFIGDTGGIVICDENSIPVLSMIDYDIPKTTLNLLVKNKDFYKMNNTTIADAQYLLGAVPLFPVDWLLVAIVPRSELTKTIKVNLKNNFTPIIFVGFATSLLIIIESLVISKVITEKEMASYRLVVSEKMNEKLRMYKHDFTNHLQIIWGLMELKHYDKAINYLIKATNEGVTIREKYEIGIPEIESTIFSVLSKAREKNIEVEMDCMRLDPNFPVKMYDLIKILANLLKNAMYALEKAEAKDKVLKIKIYEELGDYVFEIINNVPLITEDIREKIFKKGFTTKGKDGSGLGLHIVKKLAEKNKGTIKLKIDEEGNHFIVRFPY